MKFPWTNFHELNLDWFLSEWGEFKRDIVAKIESVAGIRADAESVSADSGASVQVTGGTGTGDPYTLHFFIPRGGINRIESTTNSYQIADQGTQIPTGSWQATRPTLQQGKFLWIRTVFNYTDGSTTTLYTTTYSGIDGSGAVASVNGKTGAVNLNAANIPAAVGTIQENITRIDSTAVGIDNRLQTAATAIENLVTHQGLIDDDIEDLKTQQTEQDLTAGGTVAGDLTVAGKLAPGQLDIAAFDFENFTGNVSAGSYGKTAGTFFFRIGNLVIFSYTSAAADFPSTSGDPVILFSLPEGYRPATSHWFPCTIANKNGSLLSGAVATYSTGMAYLEFGGDAEGVGYLFCSGAFIIDN